MPEEQRPISNWDLWQRLGDVHADVRTNAALFDKHEKDDDKTHEDYSVRIASLENSRAEGRGATTTRATIISAVVALAITIIGAVIAARANE